MIPTVDEIEASHLRKPKLLNIHQNNWNLTWPDDGIACAESDVNQMNNNNNNSLMLTSRTDKPCLAHDVYWRWMAMSSLNNANVVHNLPKTFLMNANDLLIAAYTGSSLMYRK